MQAAAVGVTAAAVNSDSGLAQYTGSPLPGQAPLTGHAPGGLMHC